jgi:hypothetical protein
MWSIEGWDPFVGSVVEKRDYMEWGWSCVELDTKCKGLCFATSTGFELSNGQITFRPRDYL